MSANRTEQIIDHQVDQPADQGADNQAPPGLVLLAHGSKSADWTAPFETLAASVQASWPDGQLRLGYFEHAQPLLEDAVVALYEQGCRRIHIEPLLLAPGFHLQTDLPQRMQALQAQYRDLTLTAGNVLIESARVQRAILENCIDALRVSATT